jgi:Tfp pilus assembly protein PilF
MTSSALSTAAQVVALRNEGIKAVRAGETARARKLLVQVLQLDDRDEQAWLWLSAVLGTEAERRQCLERVLSVNPAKGLGDKQASA